MIAVSIHYASNWARSDQLSFFVIHRERLFGRTPRLLRAHCYIRRYFSFQFDAPWPDSKSMMVSSVPRLECRIDPGPDWTGPFFASQKKSGQVWKLPYPKFQFF